MAADLVLHPCEISTPSMRDDRWDQYFPADMRSADVATPTIEQARFASSVLWFLLLLGYVPTADRPVQAKSEPTDASS